MSDRLYTRDLKDKPTISHYAIDCPVTITQQFILITKSLYTILLHLNASNVKVTFPQRTRVQRFFKTAKPCHIGIHWIALTVYSQIGTNVRGFQLIFQVFCLSLYLAKIATSSIRVNLHPVSVFRGHESAV